MQAGPRQIGQSRAGALGRCVAGVAATLIALAAAGAPLEPGVLERLGSGDPVVRQQATEQLLTDTQLDMQALAKLYAQAGLPEQRHRLLAVAHHHTIRQLRVEELDRGGQRAAIGIRHEAFEAGGFPPISQPGVVVVETFPGFPGFTQLRPGDLILAMDGQRFGAQMSAAQAADRFVRAVQDHQPGATVRLTIYRDGQTLELPLRLASLEALRAMYGGDRRLRPPFLHTWQAVREKLMSLHLDEPALTFDDGLHEDVGQPTDQPASSVPPTDDVAEQTGQGTPPDEPG